MQPVLDVNRTVPLLPEPLRDSRNSFKTRHAVELRRVDEHTVPAGVRQLAPEVPFPFSLSRFPGPYHRPYWQRKLLSKFEIPLVVGRHGHDGPRAVLHEHVVGDPNGDRVARGRVAGVGSGKHPGLFQTPDAARDNVQFRCPLTVLVNRRLLLSGREGLDQRVLRGEHHIGCPEHRIRPRSKHPNLGSGRCGEGQFSTLGPPNPVGLHEASGV